MLEGLLLAVGGALLLTPGFVTDAMGFLLLIPWSRQVVASYVFDRWIGSLGVQVGSSSVNVGARDDDDDAIDGDYTRRD